MDALRQRSSLLVAILLTAAWSVSVLAQPPVPQERFVERPGITEFSGQMIVRPIQPDAMLGRGMDLASIEARRVSARERLLDRTLEYVPETDEYIVALPEGQNENAYAEFLLATGDYEYAVPNWRCFPTETYPNDGGFGHQWHHQVMQSALAWDTNTGHDHIVIAIVDGGVQIDHPDLVNVVVPGYNSSDRIAQVDGGDVSDVDGHGTFVAGLAGAQGNNSTHVTGMGWDFSIMPVRYYNTPGGGFLHNVLDGIRWAADNGARVMNVSQTGVEFAPAQTTGAYVRSLGSLLVWSAGNDGRDLSWFDWEEVVIVGATDRHNNRPAWSAYGLAVDVFSPGDDILSTGNGGGLAAGGGTSASAPIVSGLAGLIWSANPHHTPEQVEQMIFTNCFDLGDPGEDEEWGHGRVHAANAVACPVDLFAPFGQVDPLDLIAFIDWFEQELPIADWDADGAHTMFDLLAFLEEYDRCS